MVQVDFNEIELAMQVVGNGLVTDNRIYINLANGLIFFEIEEMENVDGAEQEDESLRLYLPGPQSLRLGKPLCVDFVTEISPESLVVVHEIFSHKGAFGRYKSWLIQNQLLDKWHVYRDYHSKERIKTWCRQNDVRLI